MPTSGLGNCGCCADDNWDNKVRALSCHFAFHGYTPLTWLPPEYTETGVLDWEGPPDKLYLMQAWVDVYQIERSHINPITFEKVVDATYTMTVEQAWRRSKWTGVETIFPYGTSTTGTPDHAEWIDNYTGRGQWGNPTTSSTTDTESHGTYHVEWNNGGDWAMDITSDTYLSEEYLRTEYEAAFNALVARVTHARIRDKYNETEWAEAGTVAYNPDGTIGERWLVHDETFFVGETEYPNTTWVQTIDIDDGLTVHGPSDDAFNYFVSKVDGSYWSYDDDNVQTGFDNAMLNQNGFANSTLIGQSYFGWGNAEFTQYQYCDPWRKSSREGFESYYTVSIWPIAEEETDIVVQFIARPINSCPQWNQSQLPPNCCTTDAVGGAISLELGGAGYWQEWKRSELGPCSACV